MKNIAILLAGLCLCFASVLPAGAGKWHGDWAGIQAAFRKVTAVKTSFVQTKEMRILTQPLIARGVFYFKSPRSLRWEYHAPILSIMLLHQNRLRRYVEDAGKMLEQSGADLQALPVVLDQIQQWLGGSFDQHPDFTAALLPGGRIVLTPKAAFLSRMIERIEIHLAEEPGAIQGILIQENQDTRTRLDFTSRELNPSLPDAIFLVP